MPKKWFFSSLRQWEVTFLFQNSDGPAFYQSKKGTLTVASVTFISELFIDVFKHLNKTWTPLHFQQFRLCRDNSHKIEWQCSFDTRRQHQCGCKVSVHEAIELFNFLFEQKPFTFDMGAGIIEHLKFERIFFVHYHNESESSLI